MCSGKGNISAKLRGKVCAVSFKRRILMIYGQLVNVVAETVGISVLLYNVGVSMCVLRSFAVFVIITATTVVAVAAVAAAAVWQLQQ